MAFAPLKAPANEERLFPEIFLGCANEQKANKFVLLPNCANEETFAEEAKCF